MIFQLMDKETIKLLASSTYCAKVFGLQIAACWIASFVCTANAQSTPWLNIMGNAVGFYSLILLCRATSFWRHYAQSRSLVRGFFMALLTCLLASIVTAFAQYIYLLFIDGGRLMSGMLETLDQPDFTEMLKESQMGLTVDEMRDMLSQITINDMLRIMLFINVFISLAMAIPAAVVSLFLRFTPKTK